MRSERETPPSVLRGNRENRSSDRKSREGEVSAMKQREERKAALSKVR